MSRVARLGAFIVATLAVLAAGVFIIGSKEYLFSSTYQLKAQFDNVAGLAEAPTCRLAAFTAERCKASNCRISRVKRSRCHGPGQVDTRDYQARLRSVD